jgi:hypothetical protein
MRRARNVTRMDEKKSTCRDLVDTPEGQRALEWLGLDGGLMLIWFLKNNNFAS